MHRQYLVEDPNQQLLLYHSLKTDTPYSGMATSITSLWVTTWAALMATTKAVLARSSSITSLWVTSWVSTASATNPVLGRSHSITSLWLTTWASTSSARDTVLGKRDGSRRLRRTPRPFIYNRTSYMIHYRQVF